MTTIAVMQPYFFPYLGYFRLMAAADLFVVYDCVQFPRRSWVHRNRFPRHDGELDWLTLPLCKASQDTLIRDLHFADHASDEMRQRMARFPDLKWHLERQSPLAMAAVNCFGTPSTYLTRTLKQVTEALGIHIPFMHSTKLAIPTGLRGQDRILAIVEALGGTRYINAPGGRELYDQTTFQQHGITLKFLEPYQGDMTSMLGRMLLEPVASLHEELRQTTKLQD